MSRHVRQAPRSARRRGERRRASGRARALLSLGAVAALATGMSVSGTFAFFTDQATLNTGSFSSGTLDITLNGQLGGPGMATTLTAFNLSNMVPGESQSASFPVANGGSAPLTWTASGTATGSAATYLTFQLYTGSATTATTNGLRTNGCSGTALTAMPVTLGTATATLSGTARSLAPTGANGASEPVCVVATLPSTVGNAGQGTTATASIVFDAKQVGAP